MSFSRSQSRLAILDLERGGTRKHAPCIVALGYPAPYSVGIASLGAQQVHRLLNEVQGVACERFYADELEARGGPVTLESGLAPGDAAAVAFSVACETELAMVAALLDKSGLEPLAAKRTDRDPPVIIGGPLTLLDPWLVGPLADLVVVGDAEGSLPGLARTLEQTRSKAALLDALQGDLPGLWAPGQGQPPPQRAEADAADLPAKASVWTSLSELRDLFLVEASRGCSRGCAFCVMSGRANGACGLRSVPPQRILEAVPEAAPGVGLVGAAVTDHEEIEAIVAALVARGKRVSLSSIRADRLTAPLAASLRAGGSQSLTLAADGSSERLRRAVHKGITAAALQQAAEIAHAAGLRSLKLYSMVGLPGETDEDIAEFASLCLNLAGIVKLTLAVQSFVPKPGTPLSHAPMEKTAVLRERLRLLDRLVRGKVKVGTTSPRLAVLDHTLAHLGPKAALVAIRAAQLGRTPAAWKTALCEIAADALCTSEL